MNVRVHRFTHPRLAGVHLHARDWGDEDAPVLILLHGGGANARWWDHVAPELIDGWRVVALDFRGHGDSDYPEELVVGAFSDDLEALIEHLDATTVVLAGHSMGGGVALAHAATHTGEGSVRAVIAIDVARGASKRSRRSARLALALRRTYPTREEAIARYRFLPASEHAPEALRLAIARASVREEADGRFSFKFDPRWFGIPARERPPLSRIDCPVLIVRGGDSQLLTAEGSAALAAELSRSRIEVVPDAGHHVQLDQPGRFVAAVRGFLLDLQAE